MVTCCCNCRRVYFALFVRAGMATQPTSQAISKTKLQLHYYQIREHTCGSADTTCWTIHTWAGVMILQISTSTSANTVLMIKSVFKSSCWLTRLWTHMFVTGRRSMWTDEHWRLWGAAQLWKGVGYGWDGGRQWLYAFRPGRRLMKGIKKDSKVKNKLINDQTVNLEFKKPVCGQMCINTLLKTVLRTFTYEHIKMNFVFGPLVNIIQYCFSCSSIFGLHHLLEKP